MYKAVIFDFEGTLVHGNKVYSDAKGLIVKLKEVGMLLGIASNTSTRSIKERLEKNKMLHYFDTVVGIDQVDFVGKPAPDVFIQTAKNLGCEPSACLVIEDSVSGAEAAHHASMDVVVVRGSSSTHALAECHDLEAVALQKILFE